MITVLRWGFLENDYSTTNLGVLHQEYDFHRPDKKFSSFLVYKKLFFGGYVKVITLLHEGGGVK